MHTHFQTGITLLEILLVLVLVGILATMAGPKIQIHWFEQQGEFQQVLSTIRYAHQVATASECQVRVQVSGNQVSLYYNDIPKRCGNDPLINLLMGEAVAVKVSAGIIGMGWIYDEQGHPLTGQQNISVGPYKLRVEAATGFVHLL